MKIGERTYQAWLSMAPLPSNQLNQTLVELLESHDNILAKNEELAVCINRLFIITYCIFPEYFGAKI